MPYKCEKIPMPPEKDRRIKLLDCQKSAVIEMYGTGNFSINGLARMWRVSKRLIQFILFPDRKLKNLKDRQEKGGSKQYYNTQYNTKAKREYRHYKQELYIKGEL